MDTDQSAGRFSDLIGRHQKELLDLSFRNRLLNARPGRLLLDGSCEDPGRLEDALAGGRKVRLVSAEESPSPRSPSLALNMDKEKAAAACLHLYRRTQTRFDETGLQVLHLGLGLVEYREALSSSPHPRRMPAVMLAVTMTRRTARTGFAIESTGAPAEINTTLLEWLRREHSVDVRTWEDGLPTDASGVDLPGVLRHLEERLPPDSGFSVTPGVVLGHFEFQKLAMHQDLEAIRQQGLPSGALAVALGLDEAGASGGPAPIGKNELDARFKPGDLLLPLQSDAHQAAAVASAGAGSSFILKGPPGTGKSQSIANLIAHAIGSGRTVLFCAEKTAALDAVLKRLRTVGLDQYCLDLHSSGRRKANVAQKMVDAMRQMEAPEPPLEQADRDRQSDRLASLTERLNRHAEAVGRTRPNGRSLVDAVGLSEGEGLNMSFAGEPEHNPQRLDDLKGLLRRALAAHQVVAGFAEGWRSLQAVPSRDLAQGLLDAREERRRLQAALAGLSAWRNPIRALKMRKAEQAAETALGQAADALRRGMRSTGLSAEAALAAAELVVQDDGSGLRAWSTWLRCRSDCHEAGVGEGLGEALRAGLGADEALRRLECGYWRRWVKRWTTEDEALDGFSRAVHESDVAEFRRLQSQWDAGPALRWVRHGVRAAAQLPDMEGRARDATADRKVVRMLRKEAAKTRRRKPPRRLLAEAGAWAQRLQPCFMMSPLSVAQTLPLDFKFDILVFDESSQIRPWDALGAMARCRQVVLAGDDRQMPPTSFFEKQADAEDGEDEDQVSDMESALDMAAASGMRTQWLKMHYRSECPSLIDFSNREYYHGELIMMPPPDRAPQAGVSLIDPGGTYVPGAARTNQVEARAVVDWAAGRLLERPHESLGIITFNQTQQTLIEDLLDTRRMADEALNRRWDEPDPPFVKNLETVQGDERDVIALSVTWAPDEHGRQHSRFGPLGQQGGERRLNVAVTRARREMVVFSSLDPDRIAVKEATSQGVRGLKKFLEYAKGGAPALLSAHSGSQGDYDSPFEKCVAEALRKRGWRVETQIGAMGYRVDLGVVDPAAEGRYLAGVECDGASYHSSASARERDKQRQEVLESKGWRILRIWSLDWWRDKEAEADRIDAELRDLAGRAKAA